MSTPRLTALAFALLLHPLLGPLHAQAAPAPNSATLNVFLHCNTSCDTDFFRTEITYVNWVRDRAVSDIHILITGQSTGGGGSEFTLAFIGLRGQSGLADTLCFVAPQRNTPDITRRGMTRIINLGLVRFLARTTIADRLNLTLATESVRPTGTPATPNQQASDP